MIGDHHQDDVNDRSWRRSRPPNKLLNAKRERFRDVRIELYRVW